MSDLELRMIMLSTDHLEASIAFYVETLGMKLKFRDGDRFAAIDAGPITLALATADDHPVPGEVALGIKAGDVDETAATILAAGGSMVGAVADGGHERRAIMRDSSGNAVVIYGPLRR